MKIIGVFILVLELFALALQLHSECKRNNFTLTNFKEFINSLIAKLKPKSKPKPKPSMWKRRKKK